MIEQTGLIVLQRCGADPFQPWEVYRGPTQYQPTDLPSAKARQPHAFPEVTSRLKNRIETKGPTARPQHLPIAPSAPLSLRRYRGISSQS